MSAEPVTKRRKPTPKQRVMKKWPGSFAAKFTVFSPIGWRIIARNRLNLLAGGHDTAAAAWAAAARKL
jgi:hypothetical protein